MFSKTIAFPLCHWQWLPSLLFIFIIVSLFLVVIYDGLYPEPLGTANEDQGATTSHRGFNHRPTLYDGLLDRGHHTLKNQRRHVNDTQNFEKPFIEISHNSDSDLNAPPKVGGRLLSTQRNLPAEQKRFGLKTPPDPHADRSAQPLREPWDPGFQRVTTPSVPSSRFTALHGTTGLAPNL